MSGYLPDKWTQKKADVIVLSSENSLLTKNSVKIFKKDSWSYNKSELVCT